MSTVSVAIPTYYIQTPPARNAESNLPFILSITISFHVLALIAVGMRTYVRICVVKVRGMDDYTIVAAMLCAMAGMVTIAIEAPHGLGRHQDTISKADLKKLRQAEFFNILISSVLGLNLVKISISFLLLRFMDHRWYRRCLWSVILFMIIYVFVCWGTVIFYCAPVSAYWDAELQHRPTTKCYDINAFANVGLLNTGINIATDILLAVLPVKVIWDLRINIRQKIALIGVLSLGYLAVGVGVVKAFHQVQLPFVRDQTFHQGIQTWGFVQINVSIIAACMPALRPLFRFLGETVSSRSSMRGKTHMRHNSREGYLKQSRESTWTRKGYRSVLSSGSKEFIIKIYSGHDMGNVELEKGDRVYLSPQKSSFDRGRDSESDDSVYSDIIMAREFS